MSMNLHAEYDGEEAELWQTPTDVTYNCMTIEGKVHFLLTGNRAEAALDKYVEWVKSRPRDPDDISIQEQIEHVELVKKAKNLEVYVL